MRLFEQFARDEWNLGVVHQTIEDIVRHGIQSPVSWFPSNPWRIFADPFCILQPDGDVTIMAELLNHWVGKGRIWSATIKRGHDPLSALFQPAITSPIHLSYPYVIRDGSDHYLVMESYEAGGLYLWRRDGTTWRYEKTLFARPATDTTIYRDDQMWWLFCTFADDGPNERLFLFYAESLLGDWRPHPRNPVKQDRTNARPAGALFKVDGKLIRPAQDSSRTYGGSLVLNHVVILTTTTFVEVPCRIIPPQSAYYLDGIHTIAAAGDYTLIDGKRWHRGFGSLACSVTAKAHKIYRKRRANEFLSKIKFTQGTRETG